MIELLVEAGVGTEGTIRAAMKGWDTKEGIRFYKILNEAFVRTKIEHIASNKESIEEEAGSISLEELIAKVCAELNSENLEGLLRHPQMKPLNSLQGDMSKWIESFIEMVNLLLNIIHFQRIGNWEGYLQAIDEFLQWCFALNRHNYARNLSYHLMDMINLEERIPEAYEYLKCGGYSGSLSWGTHTKIPMDQIIETVAKDTKDSSIILSSSY